MDKPIMTREEKAAFWEEQFPGHRPEEYLEAADAFDEYVAVCLQIAGRLARESKGTTGRIESSDEGADGSWFESYPRSSRENLLEPAPSSDDEKPR